MDEVTSTHWIEIGDTEVEVRMTWGRKCCSCTSQFGDGMVSERWLEYDPKEAVFTIDGTEGTYDFGDAPEGPVQRAIADAYDNSEISYEG